MKDENKDDYVSVIRELLNLNFSLGRFYSLGKIKDTPHKKSFSSLKERFPEASKFRIYFFGSKIIFELWKEKKLHPLLTVDEFHKEIKFDFQIR